MNFYLIFKVCICSLKVLVIGVFDFLLPKMLLNWNHVGMYLSKKITITSSKVKLWNTSKTLKIK